MSYSNKQIENFKEITLLFITDKYSYSDLALIFNISRNAIKYKIGKSILLNLITDEQLKGVIRIAKDLSSTSFNGLYYSNNYSDTLFKIPCELRIKRLDLLKKKKFYLNIMKINEITRYSEKFEGYMDIIKAIDSEILKIETKDYRKMKV